MPDLSFQIFVRKVAREFLVRNPITGKFKTEYDWDKGEGCISLRDSKRSLDEMMDLINKVLRPYQKKEETIGKMNLSFRLQIFKINRKYKGIRNGKPVTLYDKKANTISLYDLQEISQSQLSNLIKKAIESSK